MAIKRKRMDGTISFTHDDKDARIKRLESLLKEVSEELARVTGYPNDKPIAAAATYSCYK